MKEGKERRQGRKEGRYKGIKERGKLRKEDERRKIKKGEEGRWEGRKE